MSQRSQDRERAVRCVMPFCGLLMLAFTMCSDGDSFDVTPDGQVRESDQSVPSSTQRTERPLTEAPLEMALGETRENVDPVVQKLFFLTHHKTGTFLMSALGRPIVSNIGQFCGMSVACQVWWSGSCGGGVGEGGLWVLLVLLKLTLMMFGSGLRSGSGVDDDSDDLCSDLGGGTSR